MCRVHSIRAPKTTRPNLNMTNCDVTTDEQAAKLPVILSRTFVARPDTLHGSSQELVQVTNAERLSATVPRLSLDRCIIFARPETVNCERPPAPQLEGIQKFDANVCI